METQHAQRFGPTAGPWQQRLEYVVDMMRELSRQTDPQQLVRTYSRRMREILPADGFVSLSRRDLEKPYYRITRSSIWDGSINPWKSPERLPVLRDGLLAELIYGEEPRIIDELDVSPDDPAFEHLRGHRSAAAIPLYCASSVRNPASLRRPPDQSPGHRDR